MKYWIFQGKPTSYTFDSAIKKVLLNEWNVKQHVDTIKKGDKAIIWITGEIGGCYGLVDIVTDPAVLGKSEDHDEWIPSDEDGRRHQREDETVDKVKIKFIHNLFHNNKAILKNKIPTTNGLLDKLKTGIRGTNFASSKEEFEIMLNLIEGIK